MKRNRAFCFFYIFMIAFMTACGSAGGEDAGEETEYLSEDDTGGETEYLSENDSENISENEALKAESYIDEYISLSDDTEVEGYEWMEYGEEQVLRVKIQYIDQPEDTYRHKEDYFLFIDQDGKISQVISVSYEDKGIHVVHGGLEEECTDNHSLGEGCDFDAYFEDVTFDDQMDLLISVGNSRHAKYYCVYVYENGKFRYEKTFEHIPSYEVDREQELIYGSDTDGMELNYETVYDYKNGEFVLIEENIEEIK